jgi:UDP-GlcNAc:undecaprenyl-phosphate/decaprenyl-phosphate GlcNAc-1-phosphate transferase
MPIEILKLILLIIGFFYLIKKNKKIAFKLNVMDIPNESRKFHTKPVPLTGGLFILLAFLIDTLSNYIKYNSISDDQIYLTILFFLVFLIGFIDDAFSISPIKRLVTLGIILLIFIKLIPEFQINNFEFRDFNYIATLNSYGVFITIFFILMFINANNMIDGINGIAVYFFIFVLTYIIIKTNISYYNVFLISLLLLLYLNLSNKLFLGSSGNMLMSIYLSYMIISNYNSNESFYCDEIFILFILPGFDMFRLFIQRIMNKKNPFIGDRNHLHHIISHKYGNNNAFLVWISLCTYPIILFNFFNLNTLIIFCIFLLNYFYLIITKN